VVVPGPSSVSSAAEAGADAVHPGYGFLSENAAFAAACGRQGVVFVGPSVEILESFGDKTRARRLAQDAGVPVLAGTDGPVDSAGARAFQRSLPAPGGVMVKALSGGGGRGMRRVTDPGGLDEAVRRSASEAGAAFGDDRVFVEELLAPARHIEVQILGDGTGAVTQLGERDCSIQRRNQKIIEVAPSPGLPGNVRSALLAHAVRLGESLHYRGLGTVEFLVSGERIAFIAVNPRLQVEHTITEEVTGVDLVRTQLRLAAGATLAELGLRQDDAPPAAGVALQARVNLETIHPDGSTTPSGGTLTALELPSGRGVRVDAAGYVGYRTSLRYDPLLAKVIVHDRTADFSTLAGRAHRVLSECRIDGVGTNLDLLAAIVGHPAFQRGEFTTQFLDEHLDELLADPRPHRFVQVEPASAAGDAGREFDVPDDASAVRAAAPGTVIAVQVYPGDDVRAGATLFVLEAMKMEHLVTAPSGGTIRQLAVSAGDTVAPGDVLVLLDPAEGSDDGPLDATEVDPGTIRPDLAEVLERHAIGLEDRRGGAVAKRHGTGLRTARENLADLCDAGSFVEYGALAIAAQRQRRSLEDLIERTPADGMLAGTATINAGLVGADRARVAVLSYDYTVLAGTQGFTNHKKKDRLFELAAERRLPVVVYAEGGGGRPGDVGPMAVQVPNGVVDVLVPDEAEATRVARQYLSYFQGPVATWTAPDQRRLRHVVPENRVRVYDMRAVIDGLADVDAVLELRRGFAPGMITALIRVEGRPMGLIANDPTHLGGAIDHDGADKAARFLQLCDAFGLPVISLCDTPGFMVGTESETHAMVRHFSRLFVTGANLSVPLGLIVIRKCYGLGAQSMSGGSLKAPTFSVAWPTGEFGGMGIEGAVRLGYRKELEAVEDPDERRRLFEKMVAGQYEKGKALNTATVFEIDDVIDPAETRRWITSSFPEAPVGARADKVRPFVDTW
jgi:acetyl/propionyl-CoA carboxylase alpha subunit/acetyl-CoA carboxylase carboxyltransferase component